MCLLKRVSCQSCLATEVFPTQLIRLSYFHQVAVASIAATPLSRTVREFPLNI